MPTFRRPCLSLPSLSSLPPFAPISPSRRSRRSVLLLPSPLLSLSRIPPVTPAAPSRCSRLSLSSLPPLPFVPPTTPSCCAAPASPSSHFCLSLSLLLPLPRFSLDAPILPISLLVAPLLARSAAPIASSLFTRRYLRHMHLVLSSLLSPCALASLSLLSRRSYPPIPLPVTPS
ncbi:unnamed protein product [Closterium sp. NIES-65]|nr:unnamed protein product [Closterium sp. NIES-65]